MNERIEKLAQVCFEYFEGTLDGDIVKFNHEKFAELLIKNAATFIDAQTIDSGYGIADRWCRGKDLLEHFGVKE